MVESVARWVGILVALGCAILAGFEVPGKTEGNPLLAAISGGAAVALVIGASRLWPARHRTKKLLASGALLFFAFVSSSIIAPVLASSRNARERTVCFFNLKRLGIAAQMYSDDWDDRLPIATTWSTSLALYDKGTPELKCPLAKTPFSYAMNSGLSSRKLGDFPDPSNTVLFFEADAWGPNASGGSEWLSPRHGSAFVVFADATVRVVRPQRKNELRWSP